MKQLLLIKTIRFSIKTIIKAIIGIIRLFIKINTKAIIYYSSPDVSDNSFGMFCYIINNDKSFKNIWFIDSIAKKKKYIKTISNYINPTNATNYILVKRLSFLGIYYLLTSKYIMYSQGSYPYQFLLSKKQIDIKLWHGMPLKKIGFLQYPEKSKKVSVRCNYLIATSSLFQDIMSRSFKIKKENVLITGQPRNDFLFSKKHSLYDVIDSPQNSFKNTILWMPTYRSIEKDDLNGDINKHKGQFTDDFLQKLNSYLCKIETICFIKPHPWDSLDITEFKKYSNLCFISNLDFENKGITLYSVLNSADLLLTDFSSIYIDYLLLDKPIGFLFNDFNEYFANRGFVFDNPKEYMPGEIITDKENLIPFLNTLFVDGIDNFKDKRHKINTLFNEKKTNFSENIFNHIFKNTNN